MTATFTITEPVKNGLLPAKAMQMLHGFLEGHEGKYAELTVRISEKRRSNPQNKFYMGAFISAFRECLLSCGQRVSHDDIHEGLRDAWAKNSYTIYLPNNYPFKIPPSTKRLTTQTFEDYLTEIRAEFAEKFKWQLPFPNEVPLEDYGDLCGRVGD